jgi:uncharacterized protein
MDKTNSKAEIEKILDNTYTGVLSMCDGGKPYAVPVNHAYADGCFYFHGALEGKKLDLIRKNPAVTYVITKYYGKKEDFEGSLKCHGCWESVIVYGRAKLAEDKPGHAEAFKKFMKYYGRVDFNPSDHSSKKTVMIVLEAEEITAKRQSKTGPVESFVWRLSR